LVRIPDYKFAEEFEVARASTISGEYQTVGLTVKGEFADKTAVPGHEYFYLFSKLHASGAVLWSEPSPGFRTPPLPRYYSMQEMTGMYNRPRPAWRNAEERIKGERYLAYLKNEYMHFTKLRIMMMMSTPYLRRGDIVILSGMKEGGLKGTNPQRSFTTIKKLLR
jgi:hypothetical protein